MNSYHWICNFNLGDRYSVVYRYLGACDHVPVVVSRRMYIFVVIIHEALSSMNRTPYLVWWLLYYTSHKLLLSGPLLEVGEEAFPTTPFHFIFFSAFPFSACGEPS